MTYTISAGNGAGHFDIDSDTGEITVSAAGVGNLSGTYVLTRRNSVGPTTQQITVTTRAGVETVDASHPLTRTLDGETYSWTFDRRCHCSQFIDGSIRVKHETSLAVTAVVPTPGSATVDLYTNPLTQGSRAVNGAMYNPHTDAGYQCFDERMPNYRTNAAASFPLALSAGDRLLTSKSMTTPLQATPGVPATVSYSYTCLHSVNCLTVVSSINDLLGEHYRPSPYSPYIDLIAKVAESSVPTVAAPNPILDFDGNTISLDLNGAFGSGPGAAKPGYNVGNAFAYAGQPTGFSECGVTKQFSSATSGKTGYAWPRFILDWFARLCINTGLNSSQRQILVDWVVQNAVDHYGWCRHKVRSGAGQEYAMSPINGGYVADVQVLSLLYAWLFDLLGNSTLAQTFYNLATTDSFTLDGQTLDTYASQQVTGRIKMLTSSNRSGATTFNAAYAGAGASDTTFAFSQSINWYSGSTPPSLTPASDEYRLYNYFVGAIVRCSGGVISPARFIVTGFTPDGSNDYTGGTLTVYPTFSSQGINYASVTELTFEVGSDAALAFALGEYGLSAIPGYTEQRYYDGSGDAINAIPICAGHSYSGPYLDNLWHSALAYVIAKGRTSSLWGGTDFALTAEAFKRLYYLWQWKEALGTDAMGANFTGYMPTSDTHQAYYRAAFGVANPAHAIKVPIVDTYAPVLSSCTGTQTGSTTADGSVTTDKIGTIYWGVFPSASTPSKSDVENGTGGRVAGGSISVGTYSGAGTGIGAKAISITGLSASTAYKLHCFERDAASNESSLVASSQFTTGGGDVTAPVLSSLSMPTLASGATTATATLSTDEGNGTLYWRAYAEGATPSDADVFAGTGALVTGSQAVSASGTQTVNMTGLSGGTTYKFYFGQKDTANNESNVVNITRYTWAVRWVDLPQTNGSLTPTGYSGNTSDHLVLFLAFQVEQAGFDLNTGYVRFGYSPLQLEWRTGNGIKVMMYSGSINYSWYPAGSTALYLLTSHRRNQAAQVYAKTGSGAWGSLASHTPGDVQISLNAAGIAGPIKCARYAVWAPGSPFDISDSTNQDLFVDPSTHLLKHPSIANASLGSPLIHVGDRKVADLGPDLGAWGGTWTIGSAVTDV